MPANRYDLDCAEDAAGEEIKRIPRRAAYARRKSAPCAGPARSVFGLWPARYLRDAAGPPRRRSRT